MSQQSVPVRLADLTTTKVGGPVGRFIEAVSREALVAAVREADDAGAGLLVIGGGSNILAADRGFRGTVLRDGRRQVQATSRGDRVRIVADAGAVWDDLAARAVEQGWQGFEALSGIPGTAGATCVQNVGAYGHEVSELVVGVRAWDRRERRIVDLGPDDLAFGYRTSALKRSMRDYGGQPTPRWVVLEVEFEAAARADSAPVGYGELAQRLGIEMGQRAPAGQVRQAVLALRRDKGMIVDAADPDTWSTGSFFTNPILTLDQAASLPAGAPRFPVEAGSDLPGVGSGDGGVRSGDSGRGVGLMESPVVELDGGRVRSGGPEQAGGMAALPGVGSGDRAWFVKTSAAWLIAQAGIAKGWSLGSPARTSRKHPLALVNSGGATAADILALAHAIQARVEARFGIALEIEPTLVGFDAA